MVVVVERGISAEFRRDVLGLKADGFLNEELPVDEWVATVEALLVLFVLPFHNALAMGQINAFVVAILCRAGKQPGRESRRVLGDDTVP